MEKFINNGKSRPEERVAHAEYLASKKNTATKSGKIDNNFQKVDLEYVEKFNHSFEKRIIHQDDQNLLEMKNLFPDIFHKG